MGADDNYIAVVLEEIRSQNKAVLESVGQMKGTISTLVTKDELAEVRSDVKAIRAALTDTNKDLRDHENRITLLEQAA